LSTIIGHIQLANHTSYIIYPSSLKRDGYMIYYVWYL